MIPEPELLEAEPELALAAMGPGSVTAGRAAAFDAEDEGPVARERLMAAMALIVAADVWAEKAGEDEAAGLEVLVKAAQLWVFGKRCCGQNWCLHFCNIGTTVRIEESVRA